jgi:hypothetical protein
MAGYEITNEPDYNKFMNSPLYSDEQKASVKKAWESKAYNPRPELPEFTPFTERYNGFTPGSSASQLRDYASGATESPWIAMAREKNKLTDLEARDKTMGNGQAQAAMAADSLAMQGGITSGARERLADQSSRNVMDRMQELGRQNSQRDLDLSIEGGRERMGMLGQVAGMENQQGMFNTQLGFQENQRKSQYNMDKYGVDAQIYGNQKMADATREAGGGGLSWVCTEVNKVIPHTPEQRTALKAMVSYGLDNAPQITAFYLGHYRRVIKAMHREGFDFATLRPFIDKVCSQILQGRVAKAYWIYTMKMLSLAQQFHPRTAARAEKILSLEE